ncbi:MAG TPA: NAD-binding protein [Kofleriaceae bacterium]
MIGVVGLGRTGAPIAENLRARGHEVLGYRRTAAAGQAASLAELAERCALILTVLPKGALADVAAELAPHVGGGHTVIELGSHPLADKRAAAARLGAAAFVDGEVSGTPAMTAARTAVILLAGPRDACEPALPVLRDATAHAYYVGDFGAATQLKLIANHLVAVHTAAAAEAMLLVERSGIDPVLAIEVLGLGAGSSTMWKARAPSMHARAFVDPAPGPVAMLAAYLDPIHELAAGAGVPVTLFTAAAALYQSALAGGRAHHDIGCVIEVMTELLEKGSP